MRLVLLAFLLLALPAQGPAEEAGARVRIFAPEALVASGVLSYVLPRFSLKTGIRVEEARDPARADVTITDEALPGAQELARGLGRSWHVRARPDAPPPARRLAEWLVSPIGRRTFLAYRRDGEALFQPPRPQAEAEAPPPPQGDVALGEKVAYRNCGRCHVIGPRNRLKGIGSTPSFAVLRALPDWEERFSTYYLRPPHPGFTRVAGISEAFRPSRPPPIVPIEITPEELDALLAFAARIRPADLGAPLVVR